MTVCVFDTRSIDSTVRIDELIGLLSRDLGMTTKEVVDDLEGLQSIPIQNRVSIISELWMSYS